jgi:hypothetical protein
LAGLTPGPGLITINKTMDLNYKTTQC